MNHQPKASSLQSRLLFLCYILFFTGLIFSFRAVSSISTGLLILAGIFYNKQENGTYLNKSIKDLFLFACLAFFLFQFVAFLFSDFNIAEGRRQVVLKTGMVLVPLAVCCTGPINAAFMKRLMTAYSLILVAACLFCLAMALSYYVQTGDSSHFFYHPLVSPLKQHAVYFSLLVFFALLFTLENTKPGEWLFPPALHFALLIFLSLFLVLLSSKLVLIFFAFYLLYYFVTFGRGGTYNRAVITAIAVVLVTGGILLFVTNNPVSRRFKDITKDNLAVLQQDSYKTSDYFNGLQFRLLQWKLVPEILNETNGWWQGVGAERAQELLAQKYISKNMYAGKPGTERKGYLLYNTHNQLLESLLKNGIPGALLFLFICFALLRIAWQKKGRVVRFVIVLLLLYSFNEAVLETQYGVLIFTFFPLFFSQD